MANTTLPGNMARLQDPATPAVDYRVVYFSVARGEFTVTGDEQFDQVTQNGEGVACRQR